MLRTMAFLLWVLKDEDSPLFSYYRLQAVGCPDDDWVLKDEESPLSCCRL